MGKVNEGEDGSLRRLLGKWTGVTYLRRKYKAWKARRTKNFDNTKNIQKWSGEIVTAAPVAVVAVIPPSENVYQSINLTTGAESDWRALSASYISSIHFSKNGLGNNDEPASSASASSIEGKISREEKRHSVPFIIEPSSSKSSLSEGELIRRLLKMSISPTKEVVQIPRAISEASANQYIFQRLLGSGSFSKVKLAIDRKSGEKVAIKMIDLQQIRQSPRLQETLVREIEILSQLKHPNIVRFREATLIQETICLVMDYVPGMELFQYVADRKKLTELETKEILYQVLQALHYLHLKGVVHRDLKLENILIDAQPGIIPPRVTLVDFGLARLVRTGVPLTTRCGSEEYAAPEVIIGNPYDGRLSDVWSFGVIMYACLTGSLPFNPNPQRPRFLAERIVAVSYRGPEDITSSTAAQVIRALLVKEPTNRLCVSELLRHPWFRPVH